MYSSLSEGWYPLGRLMMLVDGSAYRPSSRVMPLSSFVAADLFIEDDEFFGLLGGEA